MNLIVAFCRNRGIGINNKLPWNLKADMQRFKDLTIGNGNNAVIMGRNTWDSLPLNYRPLPKRENIVLSSRTHVPNAGKKQDMPYFLPSLKDASVFCEEKNFDDIWVIGGQHVYNETLNSGLIKSIYITQIDKDCECDTFFPKVPENFYLESDTSWFCENGTNYKFEIYSLRSSQYPYII